MFGQFPGSSPTARSRYFYLDLDRKIAEFAPGIEIPLAPFPGTLGVARAEPGQYSSVPPGRYAGNLDIRDMTEGTTLYVPVFVKGALLWTGDSHAAQGNGEINLTALETAYKEMNVTVEVIKGMRLEWPRIETKTRGSRSGSTGISTRHSTSSRAETTALLIEQAKGEQRAGIEKLMMAAWDCRMTQVVDVNKGIHCFSAKSAAGGRKVEVSAGQGKQGVSGDGRQGRRSQQGDGRRLVGDDRVPPVAKETDAARCVRPREHGDGLPSRGARRPQKAVHCLVPKSTWVASR